ncbi:hypothetical protein CC1G_03067 [Coprinopsis cinerea okayama7|uniref:lytic cellulose monooxygenase (C4-dehydrogenating) n=1 Tax=Coprinopsis cinerea (strain Okayama-7 / 130 / ATCC MYA-4618 / FGSC 9003) TaxID=240176 RepID=A8PET0_COPC7|nr:hypothetical protein CC1G_03067 [Coprinopsis cinerea okayama7\|eukprot:XP_001840838.2 hypothetical protein CC1G_03067 [Coprinopsis cinerea okayama7\
MDYHRAANLRKENPRWIPSQKQYKKHCRVDPPTVNVPYSRSQITMLKSIFTLASFVALASAHYIFPILIVDSVETPEWQYVRRTDNGDYDKTGYGPVWGDMNQPAIRCNDAARTEVTQTYNLTTSNRITNIFLARAPAGVDVADWDGDGQVWFKIKEWTAHVNPDRTMFFESTNQTHFEFDLPQSLPSGQYLLRIENIAIHATNVVGRPLQFFLSCAQINVANGGNGTPGPLVNVPGHYTGLEPGLDIDILNPPVTYIHPGPAVWQG